MGLFSRKKKEQQPPPAHPQVPEYVLTPEMLNRGDFYRLLYTHAVEASKKFPYYEPTPVDDIHDPVAFMPATNSPPTPEEIEFYLRICKENNFKEALIESAKKDGRVSALVKSALDSMYRIALRLLDQPIFLEKHVLGSQEAITHALPSFFISLLQK